MSSDMTMSAVAAVAAVVDTNNKAGIIFRNGDSYLLVLGKNWDGSHGKWGLPKGSVKVGESFEDCAIREVFEETGIIVKKEALALFEPIEYTEYDNDYKFYCIDIIRSAKDLTIPRVLVENNEVAAFGWFTRSYMKKNMWPSINRSVKAKWFYNSRF